MKTIERKRVKYEYKYSAYASKETRKEIKPMRRTPYSTVLAFCK